MKECRRSSSLSPADAALVALLCERSTAGLAQLYDRYGQIVYSVVLRIIGDPGAAEEITQDVMLRCWNSIEKYHPEQGSFVTWLLSITHHRAIDELRSRRFHEQRRSTVLHEHVSLQADADSDVALMRLDMQAAMQTLPSEQQQVIELVFWNGLTRRQVAERLGLPLGTVHTRLRLGMQKLRTACAHFLEDEESL